MKKIINLTILSTIILSLTFVPAIKTNAASTVNITYYANNGYFKAKPNRNKSKITIKNKINKKRGYAPAIRRDGYTFDGWYSKKKWGKKYSASTIITKEQTLYPHWLKKYKVNNKYFIPLGTTYPNLSDYELYWGTLKILKKKKRLLFL
ncbi:InlB B-repeat-containing protein, partial [Eubacterium ventriosum]|uniref:InlB B-repeat-containing protein n=1 Tax=Eubacterium ventriosum TaxID=39496 RepID=UPI000FED9D07